MYLFKIIERTQYNDQTYTNGRRSKIWLCTFYRLKNIRLQLNVIREAFHSSQIFGFRACLIWLKQLRNICSKRLFWVDHVGWEDLSRMCSCVINIRIDKYVMIKYLRCRIYQPEKNESIIIRYDTVLVPQSFYDSFGPVSRLLLLSNDKSLIYGKVNF